MIKSRNLSSHTYNQAVAEQIAALIPLRYYPLCVAFEKKMRELERAQ